MEVRRYLRLVSADMRARSLLAKGRRLLALDSKSRSKPSIMAVPKGRGRMLGVLLVG